MRAVAVVDGHCELARLFQNLQGFDSWIKIKRLFF